MLKRTSRNLIITRYQNGTNTLAKTFSTENQPKPQIETKTFSTENQPKPQIETKLMNKWMAMEAKTMDYLMGKAQKNETLTEKFVRYSITTAYFSVMVMAISYTEM